MYHSLAGTWHLQYSTFPMWHRRGVSDVTFNYIPGKENCKEVLKDDVRHLKDGKQKSLKGYDTPNVEDDRQYTWRGYGILMFMTSRWRIDWQNEAKDCMVISFSKTLFTPAGVDILCRNNGASDASISEAMSIIEAKGLLKNVKDPLLPVR